MDDIRSVHLDEDELVTFLGTGGTGVISFARGSTRPPHSIPVSYGFDAADGQFYFRLAVGEGSEKGDVADGDAVSFVTYGETDEGWRSVVATGTLDAVEDVDIASGVLEGLRRVDIPLVDAFERHPREVSFRFFRLVPDELTGRRDVR